MKIAHLVCVFPPYLSGISNSAYDFCRGLALLGHDLTVYTPDYNNYRKESDGNLNFKIVRFKPWLKYGKGAFSPLLFWQLWKNDYDIIHLHYPFFGTQEAVWFLKLITGKKIKLVIHYHMDISKLPKYFNFYKLISRIILRSLIKRAAAIIFASEDYLINSEIKNLYSKYENKFFKIPYGIDLNKFEAKKIKELNPKKFIVLFVGALDQAHNFKGVEILLKAFKIFNKPDSELDIVGEGDRRKYYADLVNNSGLGDKVNFLGRISEEDLANCYATSAVLVLPSVNKHEAFGLVLIEAMACGTCVLASDLPGVRKVFNDRIEGLLFALNDPISLAEKLEYLYSHPAERIIMGEKARHFAMIKYDRVNSIKLIDNLYRQI